MIYDAEKHRELQIAALAADEAWSNELQRLFGKNAGDVRYTPQAHGEPGTDLRRLYVARTAATKANSEMWAAKHTYQA